MVRGKVNFVERQFVILRFFIRMVGYYDFTLS